MSMLVNVAFCIFLARTKCTKTKTSVERVNAKGWDQDGVRGSPTAPARVGR